MKKRIFLLLFVLFGLNMFFAVNAYSQEQTEDDEIYLKVDKQPEFPGGKTALDRFIKNNLRHPLTIGGRDIRARVVCEFVVNKDGSVTDIEILRSNYPPMNNEVLRMLREMPKWEPALLKEQPVRVRYTLPVNIHIP